MSEYQYYDFKAIDRALTKTEMDCLLVRDSKLHGFGSHSGCLADTNKVASCPGAIIAR